MSEKWKLKQTTQCRECPWRVDVRASTDVPRYSRENHIKTLQTIATDEPSAQLNSKKYQIMACHKNGDTHCIGWVANQIKNNNIMLRISVLSCENIKDIKLIGEQHEDFRDSLDEEDPSQVGN